MYLKEGIMLPGLLRKLSSFAPASISRTKKRLEWLAARCTVCTRESNDIMGILLLHMQRPLFCENRKKMIIVIMMIDLLVMTWNQTNDVQGYFIKEVDGIICALYARAYRPAIQLSKMRKTARETRPTSRS
jgi:hypothetical protein